MLRGFLLAGLCALVACDSKDNNAPTPSPVTDGVNRVSAIEENRPAEVMPTRKDAAKAPASGPPLSLELYNENLYQNENGEWMLDAIAGQLTFVDVTLIDQEQIPVPNQQLKISSSGNSALVGAERETDANGSLQFAVRPVQQGEDRITVAWGGVKGEILLNVISDEALQWEGVDNAKGVVAWETLLGSRVTYLEDAIRIDFSEAVRALDGDEISVIGFIMPLESADRQQHFLLVSTPPSCFFHLPGGPVGAIEVFAEEGLEFGWGPVRLKGRFKLYAPQEYGAVYRLHEARQVSLDS